MEVSGFLLEKEGKLIEVLIFLIEMIWMKNEIGNWKFGRGFGEFLGVVIKRCQVWKETLAGFMRQIYLWHAFETRANWDFLNILTF